MQPEQFWLGFGLAGFAHTLCEQTEPQLPLVHTHAVYDAS
jgi:hypothetical protein